MNGTQVKFQCSGADAWYIDSIFIPDLETITLDAILDTDTGPQNFTITCNFGFTGYQSARICEALAASIASKHACVVGYSCRGLIHLSLLKSCCSEYGCLLIGR